MAFAAGVGGDVDGVHRPRAFAFRDQPHSLVLANLDKFRKPRVLGQLVGSEGSLEEQAVCSEYRPFSSTTVAITPAVASRSPVRPSSRRVATDSGSGVLGSGKRHSSRSPSAPTRSTSTGETPAIVSIPATQPPPSRHAIDCASLSPCRASSFEASCIGDADPKRSRYAGLTTSSDPSLLVKATGSRLSPSADPTSE